MNERISKWIDERIDLWMNGWVNESRVELTYEQMVEKNEYSNMNTISYH